MKKFLFKVKATIKRFISILVGICIGVIYYLSPLPIRSIIGYIIFMITFAAATIVLYAFILYKLDKL